MMFLGSSSFRRAILALCLAASGGAFAQSFDYQVSTLPDQWFSDASSACSAEIARRNVDFPVNPNQWRSASPAISPSQEPHTSCHFTLYYNDEYQGVGSADLGSRASSPGPTCPDPNGAIATTNITTGWASSPTQNASDRVVDYGVPNAVQDSLCRGFVVDSGVCYRSQVPAANGLYRISCDILYVVAGDPVAGEENANADPSSIPPTCPGFLGEVNGVPRCVGSVASPLPAQPSTYPSPDNLGNPTAGPRDDTAPRTPIFGDGSNAGGPASSGVASGNSLSVDLSGLEFPDPCGAPGQPSCSVTVDEAGVSNDVGQKFSDQATGLTGLNAAMNSALDQAKSVSAPGWTWTMALPSSCSPIPLAAFDFDVDVCQFQPVIHDLMSLVWIAAGFFGLFGLLGRAFNGGN